MYFVFAFVAVLTLFCMLTWVVVTVCRICFPEKPLPLDRDPIVVRERAKARGISVPVGVREIREDQRRASQQQAYVTYHYVGGDSDGLPSNWHEDLWRRRN